MANTTYRDFSVSVKAALNDISIGWLDETAGEIVTYAVRNCKMAREGEQEGRDLRGSYKYALNEEKGEARIGSPRESAYWEEFGTGSYADQSANGGKQGRQGWWVYVKNGDQHSPNGGQTYQTQQEAEAIAASMRADGLDAYATNGREPNYTLEKGFKRIMPPAEEELAERLREGLGE